MSGLDRREGASAMRQAARAVLISVAVMLAYHLVTASVARGLGMTWRQAAWFELGFLALYAGAGFMAARRTGRVWIGIVAGVAAGLADVLVGWWITAIIYRPMRIQFDHVDARAEFIESMVIVSAWAALAGAAGGWLSRRPWRRGRSVAPA